MVGVHRSDPGNTGRLGFFDGQLGGLFHHQMAHAVIAIDQSHRSFFFHHADIGREVNATTFESGDVGHHANHAVAVGTLQIGFSHQRAHGACIGIWQARFEESFVYKFF